MWNVKWLTFVACLAHAIEDEDDQSEDKLRSVVKKTLEEFGHVRQLSIFAGQQCVDAPKNVY